MYTLLLIGGFGCTKSYCKTFQLILKKSNINVYYIDLCYDANTFQQHVLYLKKNILDLYNETRNKIYLMGFSTSCTVCIDAYKQLKSMDIIQQLFLLNPATLYFHLTNHKSLQQKYNIVHSLPPSTKFVSIDILNIFNKYSIIRDVYNYINYYYFVRYLLAYVYYIIYGKYINEPFENILFILGKNANTLRTCLIECILKKNVLTLLKSVHINYSSFQNKTEWKRNNIIIYSSIDDSYSCLSKIIFDKYNNILNVKRINGNHHVLNNNPQILCDKLINDIIINKY